MTYIYLSLACILLSSLGTLAKPLNSPATNTSENHLIKLGMSNALSGPASSLGTGLKAGAVAYFKRLNSQGGINGNKVKLISLDDKYEPANAVINTKELLNQDVLALFGYVGTPTSHAIMPIINQTKTPYLMPFTGADFLRTPNNPNIFNLRASYFQEIEAQADYLIKEQKFTKIALIIQADEFGLAAQRAVNTIFKDKGVKVAFTARYKRNTNDIKAAAEKLSTSSVEAVIFVGTHQPFLSLINLVQEKKLNMVFSSLSFIGSHSILSKLSTHSKVVLTEVVPEPLSCTWKLCTQFISDMQTAGYSHFNRIQLEGYLNAFVFSQAAKRCTGKLTRQCLTKELQHYKHQDKTLNISFSPENHQGLQSTYLSFSDALK